MPRPRFGSPLPRRGRGVRVRGLPPPTSANTKSNSRSKNTWEALQNNAAPDRSAFLAGIPHWSANSAAGFHSWKRFAPPCKTMRLRPPRAPTAHGYT